MNIAPLQRFARGHHGIVSLVHASSDGVSRADWRSWCRDGVLVEVFPGVARLVGAEPTDLSLVCAATLAAGEGAIASHGSAGLVWGAPCAGTDPVHVMLRSRSRYVGLDGIRLHRPTDLGDIGPVNRRGIWTTRPLRTLVDLGATDAAAVPGVLTHFVASGVVRPGAVWNTLRRHRRRGRRGTVALEEALLGFSLGARPPDSILEAEMASVFRRHGLPPFEFHARIAGFEVDFLVVDTNVVIETDGWSTHGLDRDQFEFDREKDAALHEAGYVVLRFTWRQVRDRPAWVATRIRGALARWAPTVLAS